VIDIIDPSLLRGPASVASALGFAYLIVEAGTRLAIRFIPSAEERAQEKLTDQMVRQLKDMTTTYERLVDKLVDRAQDSQRS